MKNTNLFLTLLVACFFCVTTHAQEKVIVAYVTSWSEITPDPAYMTHINYAFGHVNESFNGVKIDNKERLKQIVALKSQAPQLKVLLSIGGWESGRFSEMAANDDFRRSFAKDCRRVVDKYNLDGIDIDWEYPTSSAAGISSSPDDTQNFTLLMKDIRAAIGTDKQLTLATAANGEYINFRAILPYIDFVNIMAYDMANAPQHHSALFRSVNAGKLTGDEAVNAHLKAGVPRKKLVMGMPFYGRGGKEFANFMDYKKVDSSIKYTENWDDIAKVPYLTNENGVLVFGYETPRSLTIKCQYILNKGLLGGMYWDYDGDNEKGELRKAVHETLTGYTANYANKKRFKALVYYTTNAEEAHVTFAKQGVEFFKKLNYGDGFDLQITTDLKGYTYNKLKEYDVVVMLNGYPMEKAERKAFQQYMENGGGWMGFHAAAYNDKNTNWPWYVNFLGGGVFYCNNWPPQPVKVDIDNPHHAVTKNLPSSFTAPESEWYQWNPSPRFNDDVEVLVTLSPDNYPLGIKDVVTAGDFPVVWTNTKYRMIYLNMGHGDDEFTDATQKLLFINAFRWIVSKSPKGNPFQ